MSQISKNINAIHKELNLPKEVKIKLLAVSKGQNISSIEDAYDAGQKIFGENYLQEAIGKKEHLNHLDIEWHFIGPIQSNKCKLIAENFTWVQTVDRIKIANKLNQSITNQAVLNVCIQVNISNEDNKSGVNINEIDGMATHISGLKKLKLRGIMAISSNTNDHKILTGEYKQLKEKYESLKKKYFSIDTLSMGMSNDYLIAIENGSNLVRIGTKIFDKRR